MDKKQHGQSDGSGVERIDSPTSKQINEPVKQDEAPRADVVSRTLGLFAAANDFEITNGNIMSAGGNITIINATGPPQGILEATRSISRSEEEAQMGMFTTRKTTSAQTSTYGFEARRSASEVYYRNLLSHIYGSPLFIPEPLHNLPVSYQFSGVTIGDVGVLTPSGTFHYFFNIRYPHDHPLNEAGVPEGFVPLSPPIRDVNIRKWRHSKAGDCVTSESILVSPGDTYLSFESSATEGAILTLPQGAEAMEAPMKDRLSSYISRHIRSWYKYIIEERDCDVENGEVRLVSGCVKTERWGTAVFTESSGAVRLQFQAVRNGEPAYEWRYSGSLETSTGPDEEHFETLLRQVNRNNTNLNIAESRRDHPRNQCLFVSTLNPTLRDDIWAKMRTEIQIEMGLDMADDLYQADRKPPQGGGGKSSNDESSSSGSYKLPHPSNELNKFIWDTYLRNKRLLDIPPTAEVVLTADNDWMGNSISSQPEELYRAIAATSSLVEEDGVLRFTDYNSENLIPPIVSIQRSSHHPRHRGEFTQEAFGLLKTWFHHHFDHPYPNEEEKAQLARSTGLSVYQVTTWMQNARRRKLERAHYAAASGTYTGHEHERNNISEETPPSASQSIRLASGSESESESIP